MKFLYTFSIALLMSLSVAAQYSTDSFAFGGITRKYILYKPAGYDSTRQYPVILALHGLGDNMTNFKNSIRLNVVADTAQFIFAIPQAVTDQLAGAAWNSGAGTFGYYPNSTVDDVGFLNALYDTIATKFNVNQKKLYACGFSMGGFMTNRLACELGNRIAAGASVSGTIGSGVTCHPARPIPMLHFHGTADQTVSYTGDGYGLDAEVLVAYWRDFDHCDTVPTIDTMPNTANDGRVVVHFKYAHGTDSTDVEFFQVIGGVHQWLFKPGGNDIDANQEIWNFLNRYSLKTQATGIAETATAEVNVYPNPTSTALHVDWSASTNKAEIKICDLTGRIVYQNTFASTNTTIDLHDWSNGMYIMQLNIDGQQVNRKIVVGK